MARPGRPRKGVNKIADAAKSPPLAKTPRSAETAAEDPARYTPSPALPASGEGVPNSALPARGEGVLPPRAGGARGGDRKRQIEQYAHADKQRANNPQVGLVTPETDREFGRRTYQYDPHLDPTLQWAGKAERLSFEVPTVSLHVHERIDPKTIIQAVKRKNGGAQPSLFDKLQAPDEPLREAIDFYRHPHGWSNRLLAGDSLLVMNSLLEKEGLGGKVQMVYLDPPYGIKYGSNFQPFVNKRDVKDGKDEDLTQEPEMIRAFRDTWELGIHSYLSYLRDRLLLARELLTESGSVFVQISDENLHHVRELIEEVFGPSHFQSVIAYRTTTGKGSATLDSNCDFVLWYSKSSDFRYRPQYIERSFEADENLRWVEYPNGKRVSCKIIEAVQGAIADGAKVFRLSPMTSQSASETTLFDYRFEGQVFAPKKGGWKTNLEGMEALRDAKRLVAVGNTLCFVRYLEDFPLRPVNNIWDDTRQSGSGEPKKYVVQTAAKVIERCILMTTDPGDLVFDPTCVRKGTEVWVYEPSATPPPLTPPARGGRTDAPSPRAGRAGEGVSTLSRSRASTTTIRARERLSRAGRRRSPSGCWTRITTAAASSRARCSSPWPETRKVGRAWPRTCAPRLTRD